MTGSNRCTNITAAGERRRRASGLLAAAAGLIVVAGLAWRDAPSTAYLAIFPFALGAAFGLLQARNQTCVVHGLRGTEEVEGGGIRRSRDDAMRAQARRQAYGILWKSVGVALLVTLLAVIAAGTTIEA